MCGQMKTMAHPRQFPVPVRLFRTSTCVASAAENDPSAVDGAVNGLNGWIACFDKAGLKGVVRRRGRDQPGDIRQNAFLRRGGLRHGQKRSEKARHRRRADPVHGMRTQDMGMPS